MLITVVTGWKLDRSKDIKSKREYINLVNIHQIFIK